MIEQILKNEENFGWWLFSLVMVVFDDGVDGDGVDVGDNGGGSGGSCWWVMVTGVGQRFGRCGWRGGVGGAGEGKRKENERKAQGKRKENERKTKVKRKENERKTKRKRKENERKTKGN